MHISAFFDESIGIEGIAPVQVNHSAIKTWRKHCTPCQHQQIENDVCFDIFRII